MEAAGARRVALFGQCEGGSISMLFAATHPERIIRGLVLFGALAVNRTRSWSAEQAQATLDQMERNWGTGASLQQIAPSKLSDDGFRSIWGRFERQSASPGTVVALTRMNRAIDIRHIPRTFACRALCYTGATIRRSMLATADTSPRISPPQSTLNYPAAIIFPIPVTAIASSTRSKSS